MTREEKQLLLKDLCARLPYGVIINVHDTFPCTILPYFNIHLNSFVSILSFTEPIFKTKDKLIKKIIKEHTEYLEFKPYLRPMSSMTDEEFLTLYDMCRDKVFQFREHPTYYTDFKTEKYVPTFIYNSNQLDYLISHHFDYHGLIPMELALEAPEDMYNV